MICPCPVKAIPDISFVPICYQLFGKRFVVSSNPYLTEDIRKKVIGRNVINIVRKETGYVIDTKYALEFSDGLPDSWGKYVDHAKV